MTFQKGSIRRSLYYSILDGLFTAMMLGVSDFYLIPYGIALGATAFQTALLVAVPMLVAALLQSHSARVAQEVGSRMRMIRPIVLGHSLAWIPVIAIPYVFEGPARVWALLGAATVLAALGAFAVPAWQSLLSDYIPVKKRGAYFGWRNRLQGFMTVGVTITAGLVLHAFGKGTLTGFTIIFGFAMMCRFYAWACLSRMVEPFRKTSHDEYFSFFEFLKQMRTSNFARFVLFVALMNFAANMSGALLPAFLLKSLGFDYATFMVLVVAAALSGFLFQGIWGKFGDLDGNIKVIRVAAWGIALTPLLWMVSRHPAYLLFVQLFAGCVWAGFNMLVLNFTMEAVSPAKRIRCLSYLNVMTSLAVFCGASLGGFLLHRLPPLQGYSYLTLFLLSCLVRLAVVSVLSKKVREVRRAAA